MAKSSGSNSWGPTLLRLVVGVVFVAHGWQKIHTGIPKVAGFMGMLKIPAPTASAVVLTAVEFLGGIAMILGAATRGAALLIAFDMSVAILAVHLKNGFFAPTGYEYALTLLVACLSLALTGGGAASMDSAIGR